MANIHRIGDYSNNNINQNFIQNNQQMQEIPLIGIRQNIHAKDPRKENICDLFTQTCCPTFRMNLFLVFITILQIIIFVVSLSMSKIIQGEFLSPDIPTLLKLGAKCAYRERYQYEIYRFITPIFLHANFMHIMSNIFSQLIFGISLETTTGSSNIIIIYMLSGIGGNLFSSLITDSISVGASTSILGIMGSYLGFLTLNWKALEPFRQVRCQLLCVVSLNLIIVLLLGVQNNSLIDNYGHLGGMITGYIVSMIVMKPMIETEKTLNIKKMSWVFGIFFYLGGFALFYSNRTPLPC